ncbi:RNA methylase [Artomyces pyxidatus]|uniref:RNA methylase n=1 Tax=Artomyces pyxidatus TaxID=48021 RepID=A0ACB8TBJ4_9AGAM|nr:RNA methylase [Artomyces pyxidatus]
MSQYLIVFAQAHEEFRLPELLSVAELHHFDLAVPDDLDVTRPFAVFTLDKEEHARLLARRCILIKSVYEFYARGTTYEELHQQNKAARPKWEKYTPDTSFKFVVNGYNQSIPKARQREVIENFSYMDFLGKIDLKTPEVTMGCFEEYRDTVGNTRHKHEGDGNFREAFFGRLLEEGTARSLIKKFDVKKRLYFGNTSMEAEISLLMANQTLASPGKVIYDPFVGTGSMAYTTAHFGALVFGSDIDGRQMRGKGGISNISDKLLDSVLTDAEQRPGIMRAAAQYGVEQRVIDLCTFDVTQNPWRCGEMFDAIITDPPYGVRAGAKRLGRKKERGMPAVPSQPRPDDQPYIPPTKPYELADLAADLVVLARYLLKPGGRLVFFLPTVTDEYREVDINTMLCGGMEVIANSLQDFGAWGRRLVTIRKTTCESFPPPTFESHAEEGEVEGAHIPAHKDFRGKYFQGFKKEFGTPVEAERTQDGG